jgi:hypothetical protein
MSPQEESWYPDSSCLKFVLQRFCGSEQYPLKSEMSRSLHMLFGIVDK